MPNSEKQVVKCEVANKRGQVLLLQQWEMLQWDWVLQHQQLVGWKLGGQLRGNISEKLGGNQPVTKTALSGKETVMQISVTVILLWQNGRKTRVTKAAWAETSECLSWKTESEVGHPFHYLIPNNYLLKTNVPILPWLPGIFPSTKVTKPR